MRNRSITAQVEIPFERLERQFMALDFMLEGFVVILTLAPADDLTIAFGSEHIDAQRDFRARRILLHVERFTLRRIAMDHHRTVEFLRYRGLFVAAQIVA